MTLQELKDKMTIKEFNAMVITFFEGDYDYIGESLPQTLDEYDPDRDSYFYHKLGLCHENFPFNELQSYVEQIAKHLTTNLIIPLP